ncbi:MAG TPA: hypothetical protein VEU55_08140 [Gemmatimonadales bacterium]|nr:hypothetical protein [Gemmatimonadales bacterium]
MNHDEELNDAAVREVAQRLGARAAERLDVEQVVQGVLTRLREQRGHAGRQWRWIGPVWLRIAAAVVVLVGAGLVVRRGAAPAGGGALAPAGAELTGLSTEQLREVLRIVDQPTEAPEPVAAQDAGLEDLTAPQLRALLASLES